MGTLESSQVTVGKDSGLKFPANLIERKIDYRSFVTQGYNSATANLKDADIQSLTSLTVDYLLSLSPPTVDATPNYAYALGYVLGALHKVAIISAKKK